MSLVELLIVIGIIVIVLGTAIPGVYYFRKEMNMENSADVVMAVLRQSQENALASVGGSKWGVYFSAATVPQQYTLFKGVSYLARDISSDVVHRLPRTVVFSSVNLDGGEEVVFERLTGFTNQPGNITISREDGRGGTKTIYLERSGLAHWEPLIISDNNRLKDSRHVHFDYARTINTATEKIILSFNGGVKKEILFSENTTAGQFSWQGNIEVSGQNQTLTIHTHRLNNPDTQFCVHRLGTENNQAVSVDIDGDVGYPSLSPTLILYESNGSTTQGQSSFVLTPIWQ